MTTKNTKGILWQEQIGWSLSTVITVKKIARALSDSVTAWNLGGTLGKDSKGHIAKMAGIVGKRTSRAIS